MTLSQDMIDKLATNIDEAIRLAESDPAFLEAMKPTFKKIYDKLNQGPAAAAVDQVLAMGTLLGVGPRPYPRLVQMTELSASKKKHWDACEGSFAGFYGGTKDEKELLKQGARDLSSEVGNLVHKTLEIAALERLKQYDAGTDEYVNSTAPSREPLERPVTIEELRSCFDEAIKTPDRFGERYYSCDAEVMKAAIEILDKCPKRVSFKHLAVSRGKHCVEGEHRVQLGEIEPGVNGSVILYLDRVDEPTPGHVKIVDYKSGNYAITSEEAEWDPQVTLYLVAGRELFPDAKTITVELSYLASGKKAFAKWTPTLDWWTRSTYRETLRRIRTQKTFAERPGWQCMHCFRREECVTYKRFLEEGAAKTAVHEIGLEQLVLEWHDNKAKSSILDKRQKEIEQRFKAELKKASVSELVVGKWAIRSGLGSNHTNYDPVKVWDAFRDRGLSSDQLLSAVSVTSGKLEDVVDGIPDADLRKKVEADLELIGERNLYRTLSVKEAPRIVNGQAS